MGILVSKRYPTMLAIGLADHTYVECHTQGRAWGCWGGKSNGTTLRWSAGSTRRADLIAQPDEKAGIRCYGINGVCHQAANRILLPARATVRGARGYKLSEAIYGPYGRARAGICASPFQQYPGVKGDLPECAVAPSVAQSRFDLDLDSDAAHLDRAQALYREFDALEAPLRDEVLIDLHVRLFMLLVERELGSRPDMKFLDDLVRIRTEEERERISIEDAFTQTKMPVDRFVEYVNELTVRFQDALEKALPPEDFAALVGLLPGDRVVLVDPNVAKDAYRDIFK